MPKQSIPIELGGKTRHLRLDFNALCELEGALGMSMFKIAHLMESSVSISQLRAMLWAGLLHETPDLTLTQVGVWIDDNFGGISDLADGIRESFEASFEGVAGGAEKKQQAKTQTEK